MSEEMITGVVTVASLLVGSGSGVVADTRASLTRGAVRPELIRNVVVTSVLVFAATLPTLQVKICPWLVHGIDEETKSVPGVKSSVRTTPSAFDGPGLLIVNVYVSKSPATTKAGAVLVRLKSDELVMVVVSCAVLLLALVSVSSVDTVAWLSSEPVAAGSTNTWIVAIVTAPTPTSPGSQRTIPRPALYTQPLDADVKVTPLGRVSVIATPVAMEGPAFEMDSWYVKGFSGNHRIDRVGLGNCQVYVRVRRADDDGRSHCQAQEEPTRVLF